jgi:gluconate 2-dehydrogenase alpha chain
VNSTGLMYGQIETLPYETNFLDLDPVRKDPFGEPVIRVTYDLHDNEKRAGEFVTKRLEQILTRMGASKTWYVLPPIPMPVNSHAYGGTRMGTNPATSVVDGYCISHEVPNLAILGGSTFVSATGYNPTETIQALSWRSAEYVAQNFARLTG